MTAEETEVDQTKPDEPDEPDEPGQSYVHCEMCGYRWRWEEWSPEMACPRCGDGSNRRRHSKASKA